MAFENLSQRLQDAFRKLRGKGKISESDLKAAMREVKLALLEADAVRLGHHDLAEDLELPALPIQVSGIPLTIMSRTVIVSVNEILLTSMDGVFLVK